MGRLSGFCSEGFWLHYLLWIRGQRELLNTTGPLALCSPVQREEEEEQGENQRKWDQEKEWKERKINSLGRRDVLVAV